MEMVTKQDITKQKMYHTAIIMTWGDFFFKFKIYFRNIPTKSFDEKPVRAKMQNKDGKKMMATLSFDINRIWSVGHDQIPVVLKAESAMKPNSTHMSHTS